MKGLFPSKGFPAKAEVRSPSPENPRYSLGDPAVFEMLGATPTASGVSVNERTAMSIGAVYACVRIIAEAVASLPLITYKRLARGKERATDHPLYFLLHDQPNPEMSSMTFRETLQAHALTYGNGFAEIETNKAGGVIGLWPLMPDRTSAKRVNGEKVYETILPDGTPKILADDRVFHLPGLGFDGLTGYSPIQLAKQSLGLTSALEQFGASFFAQGASMSGVLEHPGKLSDQASKHLRESFEKRHTGLSNSHRIMIAEEGMKWAKNSVEPNAAQFIESRRFQVIDVARLFRVPPHMLGDLQAGASFASVEQMGLDFVAYTLRPWLVRWEQTISKDLYGARERATYYSEHLVEGLLRGDIKSRYEAYAVARQNGWLSANDIRETENMNPVEGGDAYLVNGNMIPADQAGQTPAPAPAADPSASEPTDQQRAAFLALFRDVGERMNRRHVDQLRKVYRKQGEAGWLQGVEGVYRDQHDALTKALTPVFDALLSFGPPEARALGIAARGLAAELATDDLTESRAVIDAVGFAGAETVLAAWEATRAEHFATRGAAFVATLLTPSLRRVA